MSAHPYRPTPVVVVGGFSTPTWALSRLVRGLRRSGLAARPWSHRLGLACSEDTLAALEADLHDRDDPPPVLVGFSRGSHFCEVLARRRPAALRGLVSLGGPSVRDGPLSGVNGSVRRRIVALGRLGSRGVPRIVTSDCLHGGCCRRFWADVDAPDPLPVPHRVVAADRDRVVTSLNLRPDVVVPGGHARLLRSNPMDGVLPPLVREVLGALPDVRCR